LPSAAVASLVQVRSRNVHAQAVALAALKAAARHQHLPARPEIDLIAFALSGKKIGFEKVIKMIDDMVANLKQEQIDDDSKKEYCTLQLDQAEDKAKELQGKVEDLTTSIEEKEGLIKEATEEIKMLTKSIKKLDKSVSDATYQRKKEHDEFVELMSSNNAAKELMNFAKNRLNKFYNPKLHKAEEAAPSFVQIREHNNAHKDAPEPPPATWEGGYKKKGEETNGVISMIDLLIRDLDKEMTEAKTEEDNAQKDYEEMMNDSAKKRAADTKAMAAKEAAKAEAEEGKVAAEESKMSEFKELTATKQYEQQLHSECDWLIQNFDLRKSMRAEEMDNLKQAKAVLSGAEFSLLQSKAKAAPPRNLRGL